MNHSVHKSTADWVGVVTSALCLVHCIFLPLLTVINLGVFQSESWDYVFIVVAFISVFNATQYKKVTISTLLLWLGFWTFLFSTLFHQEFPIFKYIGYCSSTAIIIGHCINIKQCKKCNNEKVDNKTDQS